MTDPDHEVLQRRRGPPKRFPETLFLRLEAGTLEAIDATGEDRSTFVRRAIERALMQSGQTP